MRTTPTFTLAALAAAVLLAGCGAVSDGTGAGAAAPAVTSTGGTATTSSAAASPTATADGSTPAPSTVPGAYLTLAEYEGARSAWQGTKVVYFFHAPWCPTCRAAEKAIVRDGIPAGLTVVKVDFDGETDLRRQYGVTTQHTFVQVDPSGAELATWSGSRDGAEILGETV